MTDQENGTPVGDVTEEQVPEPAAEPETGGGGGGKPYSDDDKIHLFLAYFGLFSLIPFFMFRDKRSDPQKEFVYWHARQGLAFTIAWAVAIFVVFILAIILAFVPVVGWILSCLLYLGLAVAGLGGAIMGWVKAFAGEKWEMPVVCKLAEMFK